MSRHTPPPERNGDHGRWLAHRLVSGPNRPRRGERGVIAGGEGLAFGVLILLAGSLALINIWAIVDTRTALDAASREYLRTYTEQSSAGEALLLGDASARRVLHSRGTRTKDLTITVEQPAGFGPCSAVTVRISATVHWFKVPFLDGFGDAVVTAENRELVDAHRDVTVDASYDRTATACYEG